MIYFSDFAAAGGPPPWEGAPGFIAYAADANAGSNTIAVPYPGGIQAYDIALLQVQIQDFNSTEGVIDAISGWTQIDQGTFNTSKRHAVFWRRLTGAESGTVDFAGTGTWGNNAADKKHGAMSIWRGCVATGDPFEGVAQNSVSSQTAGADSAATTTTGADRTVLNFVTCDDDTSSSPASGWTERYDEINDVSIDSGVKLYSIERATADTYSGVRHTLAANERWSVISFALIPN